MGFADFTRLFVAASQHFQGLFGLRNARSRSRLPGQRCNELVCLSLLAVTWRSSAVVVARQSG